MLSIFLYSENSSPAISQEPSASFLCVGWHLTVVSDQWLVTVSNCVVTAPSSTFIISLCGFSGAADTLGLKFGKMYKQSGYIWIRVESEFWASHSQMLKLLWVDITYVSFVCVLIDCRGVLIESSVWSCHIYVDIFVFTLCACVIHFISL